MKNTNVKKTSILLLVFLLVSGVVLKSSGSEKLYSINELTENQKQYLLRENKVDSIFMGLALTGLGFMVLPYDMENISSPGILSLTFGFTGVYCILRPFISDKKDLGILVYNKKKGIFLERMGGKSTLKNGLYFCAFAILSLISIPDYDYGPDYYKICRYGGFSLICLSGLIEFIDSFKEDMPTGESEGYVKPKEKKKSSKLNFDLRKDYLGIRIATVF